MCDQKLKVVTVLMKRKGVLVLLLRGGADTAGVDWLPVVRANSLQSASSQILVKVVKRLATTSNARNSSQSNKMSK